MIKYLINYIFEHKKTGMILSSGDSLVDSIVNKAELKNKKVVVELGAGTGVITKGIINSIRPGTVFFALEINDYFVKKTNEMCPGATVYHDSAENIQKYLKKHNLKKCDCVISGLPWVYISKTLQNKIIHNVSKSLNEDGVFVAFAYAHALVFSSAKKFKKLLEKNFSSVNKSKIIWNNFPPSIVYYAKK